MPPRGETFHAPSREAWRTWLERNHASENQVWLVREKKHVASACVSYEDAVEEALCFGWIDGQVRRIDDSQYMIRFSPRKRGSIWAESNKQRVEKMIREGKMTEAGTAVVRQAQQNGWWDRPAGWDREAVLPADLEAALRADDQARRFFEGLPPSQRAMYVWWVMEARRSEVRERRIREVVRRSASGIRPGAARL